MPLSVRETFIAVQQEIASEVRGERGVVHLFYLCFFLVDCSVVYFFS